MVTKEELICLKRWDVGDLTCSGDCSKITNKTRTNSQKQLLGSFKTGMLTRVYRKNIKYNRFYYRPSQYFLNLNKREKLLL